MTDRKVWYIQIIEIFFFMSFIIGPIVGIGTLGWFIWQVITLLFIPK